MQSIETVFRATMQGVVDPSLPVRVQAALVLPNLVPYERIRDQLALDIRQVIQVLLKLSNEVDLDNLTNVTRVLVSHFSDELLPFAHDLMQSLQLSYMRILNDVAEARRAESAEADDDGDEKLLAAVNILKTMQQILLGLENNGESLKQVEGAAISAVGVTLRDEHTGPSSL